MSRSLTRWGGARYIDCGRVEPTNHLDRSTRRRLIDALDRHDGTILCASHDPAILERVATRVFEVADGGCRELEERRTDWALDGQRPVS